MINYISNKLKKNTNSFKKLGSNAVGLTKYVYITEIVPFIDKYMLTDKIDGERVFMVINKSGIHYISGSNIFSINEKSYDKEYIFDGEKVNDIIYLFDIILFENNILDIGFDKRYDLLIKFQQNEIFKEISNIKIKKFIKLTINNYQKEILNMYKKQKYNLLYDIDGLIFTNIEQNYTKTKNFKWKPIEKLTIDFLAVKIDKNFYRLLVGIDKNMFKNLGLSFSKDYAKLVKNINSVKIINNILVNDYFPYPFENSLFPYNISYFKSNLDLDKKIIELSWDKSQWKFHRIRSDRDDELRKGNYFGNNFKIADITFQMCLNPLDLKILISPYNILTKDFYFQKKDSEFIYTRKFNNYVKNLIISNFSNKNIMDLASGKGQDINKYINANTKNLICLEIDKNAIDEFIQRRYNIYKKDKDDINIIEYKPKITNIKIFNVDLNNYYQNNIDFLNINIKFDALICNFAFHYFINNNENIDNIIQFISYYLDKYGSFVFTALDGLKVYNLLKENNGKWIEDKYKIISENLPKQFSSNVSISIKLPFSNELYKENLINILDLDKKFKKNNMIRIEHKSFKEYLNDYKKFKYNFYSNLNEADIKFISLYSYTVYKKLL